MKLFQIYVEQAVVEHPMVQAILSRYPNVPVVIIEAYQEIFNRHKQHFRVQKETPCLILAKKYGKYLHPIPKKFGLGFDEHYYFSTVLNCPFDCQYCFLQGQNKSAHYVVFVNHEDFKSALESLIRSKPQARFGFFSGYDGDSLALNSLSRFCESFLPFFTQFDNAVCEYRTKSTAIHPLIHHVPDKSALVAYSLNPQAVIDSYEPNTPPLDHRLKALRKLLDHGYQIGLRFDPLLLVDEFKKTYETFFEQVFKALDPSTIHSVTLGTFRMPKPVYHQFLKLGACLQQTALLDPVEDTYGYPLETQEKMIAFCREKLLSYIPPEHLFLMH